MVPLSDRRRSGDGGGCCLTYARVTFLAADWESLVSRFISKHGVAIDEIKLPSIHDPTMPSQLFERFEERLHDDRLNAETLALVVSLQEEEMQINKNPQQPKQLDITVDADLTIQTRKYYMSSMPSGIEELRKRYSVMKHLCLLDQMRQSSRAPFSDLSQGT